MLEPKAPMASSEMLATAAGLPSHRFCPRGCEAMSMAFFRGAGTDRLCSGVTNRTASVARTSARNESHSLGASGPSRSGLYIGSWMISAMRRVSDGGAREIRLLASFRLKAALRRLPMMTMTCGMIFVLHP